VAVGGVAVGGVAVGGVAVGGVAVGGVADCCSTGIRGTAGGAFAKTGAGGAAGALGDRVEAAAGAVTDPVSR